MKMGLRTTVSHCINFQTGVYYLKVTFDLVFSKYNLYEILEKFFSQV